jgi:hypothetical protein
MAARVLRIVFRLDYDEVNYDFLDRQGTALRILSMVPDNFWSRVGDGTAPRSFAAEFFSDSKDVFRNLNTSAMSLDGSIESRSGIALDSIPEHKDFRSMAKILTAFCHEFNVTKLNRCGLRLYCIDTCGDNYVGQFQRFLPLMGSKITPKVETVLGEITDLGLSYDGKATDGIGYRIRLGPFQESDLTKLLGRLRPTMEDEPFYKKAHVSMDLDFFEHDVSFRELTIERWARTHWAKADAVLGHVRSSLSGEG